MAHIWSGDVVTGFTYNGTFDLESTLQGSLQLYYSHIDEIPIPWIYPGVNELVIIAAGLKTVTFPSFTEEKTDPVLPGLIATFINVGIIGSGITCTCVYNSATDAFDCTFTAPVDIVWALSSSRLVWNHDSLPEGPLTVLSLDAQNVTGRPAVLELVIEEAQEGTAASRVTDATFFIPVSDFQLQNATFSVQGNANALTIAWCQVYAPGIPCAMDNQWHLLFADI